MQHAVPSHDNKRGRNRGSCIKAARLDPDHETADRAWRNARVPMVSAALSDIGRKRAANEDFFSLDEERGLFVVADGLGGHVAGRTASETAVGQFMQQLRAARADIGLDTLRDAVRGANAAILARVREVPYLRGMGTTLAGLRIADERARFVHIGDSRIYLLRRDELHLLTLDHSYVCELVFRRRMTPASARTHPNRHVITRALGVEPPAEPDASELLLEPDDLFVLCTDGITGPIEDEELREILVAAPSLDDAAGALVECANARGGQDNATVILVRV
jgi:PPM family protein phosphatase